MNICFPFCDTLIGGAEIYALNLACMAKKSGHRVSFILSKKGPLTERLEKEGIEYSYIPMESSFNPLKVITSIQKLKRFYKENEINIVHCQMLREQSLTIGAKIFGAKVRLIRTFHRLDQFNLKMVPFMWLYRNYTDYVIAISEYLFQKLKEKRVSPNLVLIRNGVEEIIVTSHQKAIGYIGRLSREKGILTFLNENADRLTGAKRLIIAGDGPDREKILETVEKRDLKGVEYLGVVSDRKKFFSKISVLFLPSETEVLPLVALEGFSANVPVVAFDLPGLKELVKNDNGVLIEKGNYRKMADICFQILDNEDNMSHLAQSAKQEYLEKYTFLEMWTKTKKLYQFE